MGAELTASVNWGAAAFSAVVAVGLTSVIVMRAFRVGSAKRQEILRTSSDPSKALRSRMMMLNILGVVALVALTLELVFLRGGALEVALFASSIAIFGGLGLISAIVARRG